MKRNAFVSRKEAESATLQEALESLEMKLLDGYASRRAWRFSLDPVRGNHAQACFRWQLPFGLFYRDD
jgi:hypothetical protein